jgi:hypothetical protein
LEDHFMVVCHMGVDVMIMLHRLILHFSG